MANRNKFPLGVVVATPGALAALETAGRTTTEFLDRHVAGDWGVVSTEDWHENEWSLENDQRLLSAYPLSEGLTLWIITEADRSSTTILLPEEY
jgi:hypothetical protein